MEHDKLFADLDALNEQHIEVGLAAGVWKVQVRALVQHYLYDLKLKRVEAAADRLTEMEKAMRLAVGEAIKAKTRASAALIIAVGAMVAAMAGALSRSSLCGNMVASRPGDGLACTLLATEKHPERNIRSPPPFGVFHPRRPIDDQVRFTSCGSLLRRRQHRRGGARLNRNSRARTTSCRLGVRAKGKAT